MFWMGAAASIEPKPRARELDRSIPFLKVGFPGGGPRSAYGAEPLYTKVHAQAREFG
jgi:hypothetical protein